MLGDFRTSEQRIPASAMLGRALEVNMTINDSWGYNPNDLHWKSAQQLIRNLSDIASKDGNYLLNVGPTAEGEIPQPEVDRLLAMGRWLKTNGEAIYATEGGPFIRAAPVGPHDAEKTSRRRHDPLRSRLGMARGRENPFAGRQAVRPLRAACSRAARAVTSTVTPEGLVVTLPGAAPDPDVSVAALEFAGPVEVPNCAAIAERHRSLGHARRSEQVATSSVAPGRKQPQLGEEKSLCNIPTV